MKITKKSPATLIRKNEGSGYHLAEVSDGSPMFSKTSDYLTFASIVAARKFANRLGHKLVWD